MAYMNKERKAQIKAELAKVLPKGWKISMRVDHHTSLDVAIMSAPVDLMQFAQDHEKSRIHYQVNHYHLGTRFHGEVLEIMEKIRAALNCINHDRSDIQSDYFDVGYYLHVSVGKWNKPFVCVAND